MRRSTSPSPTAPTCSDLHAVDQHGVGLSPRARARPRRSTPTSGTPGRSRIGAVAAGKTIDRILVGYDNPGGTGRLRRLDRRHRPRATAGPRAATRTRPTAAITTRGTNSTGSFSRGNNFPATAVPHGFNFWTPVTDAGSMSWLYDYQRDNNADNLPAMRGVRGQPRAEPVDGRPADLPGDAVDAAAPRTPTARSALPFRHDNEVARPHYYGVTFENGSRPRSRRPTTRRCSASRSRATPATCSSTTSATSGGLDRSTRTPASSPAGRTSAAASPTARRACSCTRRSTSRCRRR